MTKEEIIEKREELREYKGLIAITLSNERNYPGMFHTDHAKGVLAHLEQENKWVFVVRPGFGLGWEESIEGKDIVSIDKSI